MNSAILHPAIRLFIVDDHKVVRAGLRQLLEEAEDFCIVAIFQKLNIKRRSEAAALYERFGR